MRTFYTIILGFLFCTNSFATLTVGNVPVTKTGGSTPVIQNSDITDTGGNVGVGSTSPGQQLDVNGTIRATVLVKSGGTSSQFLKADGSVDSSTYSTATGANPTATVGTSAVNGSSANFMRADGAPAINLTMSPTWTGNNIFSPSSGNTLFSAGNVGINSTLPGQLLDVRGTVRMTGFNMPTGASNTFVLTSDASGTGTWAAATGAGTVNSGTTGQNAYYASSTNAVSGTSDLIFNGNDAYFSSGNVGIGTTQTANAALTVMNGNIGIGTWKPTYGVDIKSASAFLHVGSGTQPFSGSAGANGFFFENSGSSNDFIVLEVKTNPGVGFMISNSGNVGMGTYVPKSALDLKSGNFLAENGNVGIGSTLPGQVLDVRGTARISGATPLILTGCHSSTGTIYLCVDTAGNVSCSASACSGT